MKKEDNDDFYGELKKIAKEIEEKKRKESKEKRKGK